MTEILWHGRGGQGAFTAAKILGTAFTLKGDENYALCFPSFGPERRGAPIRAFSKLDNKHIHNRSEIVKSDFLVYLDDTLYDPSALLSLKPGGKIILNTAKTHGDTRVVSLDANRIAREILKLPIVNTAMLGVLSSLFPEITLREIEKAIEFTMPAKLVPGNIAVVRAAKEAIA